MAKIESYKYLRCWKQAPELVIVCELIRKPDIKDEFKLSDQLKRTRISAMTNIAEEFSRCHKKDFIPFLNYAQSLAQEEKSLLYIVADREMINAKKVKVQDHCDHCQALIFALLRHIKNSEIKSLTRRVNRKFFTWQKN